MYANEGLGKVKYLLFIDDLLIVGSVHLCYDRHAGRKKHLYITVQRAPEIKFLHSRGKGESADLENFKMDNTELNEILKSADRPSVKQVNKQPFS